MPQRALEVVFAEVKEPAVGALNRLAPALPDIVRNWRRTLRRLDLSREAVRVLSGLDLKHALERLQVCSYATVRSSLKHLAGELAAAGIVSEQALAAFYLLLEQCLPLLKGEPETVAITRLTGILVGMVVAGYSAHWESSQLALSHRLTDAQRRLHGASAYVTQVYEMERRRLSHDLHDEIGHDLMLLKLYLEVMLRDLPSMGSAALQPKLEQSLGVVQHAIDSARRLVLDLGPAIFDELGFQAAIRSYARQFAQRTGVHVDLRTGPLPDEIPMSHQVALYRVLQGALGNVFKHSEATRVTVTVGRVRDGELFLVVEDNGTGFDVTAPRKEGSVGLTAMRERIEVLGGTFRIDSTESGTLKRRHGTRIEVGLPLPQTDSITRSKRKRA